MDTLVYAPFYLLGLYEQAQTRKIELFKNYIENAYRATTLITIEIDNPHLQIYAATLTMQAQFNGLRYYMHYWPISTAVVCIASIFCVISFLMGSSWIALSTNLLESHDEVRNQRAEVEGIADAPQNVGQRLLPDNRVAPNQPDTSLGSTERASIHVDNHTEVTNLGVTPLDSSDMTEREQIVRRRNHSAEGSSA